MANFCGSCGSRLSPNAKFCGGCGSPVSNPNPICPTCGQDIPQDSLKVEQFGPSPSNHQTSLLETQTNPPTRDSAALPVNRELRFPKYGIEFVAGLHCGNCGFDAEGKNCPNCGTDNISPLVS